MDIRRNIAMEGNPELEKGTTVEPSHLTHLYMNTIQTHTFRRLGDKDHDQSV